MDNNTEHTAPKRLTRRSEDKVIAGVAGGLADYTGIDPVIFRIAFVALAIAGGSGLLLYLLAWLVIPEGSENEPVGQRLFERIKDSRWLGMLAIVIGVLIVISMFHAELGPWEWAVALLVIGFLLLRDEPSHGSARTTSRRRAVEASAGTTTAATSTSAVTERVRRPRSALGLMTLGAALLAVAGAVLLANADVVHLDIGQYFALAIAVLGVGLIVGGWWGRSRLSILLALGLVPFMLAGSMIHMPLRGELGDHYFLPRTEVSARYEVLAGALTLDFTNFRFPETPTEVDLRFVAGDVNVLVPPGVNVRVDGTVELGVADVFGESYEGKDIAFSGIHSRDGLTDGELIIHVEGGLGSFDTTWATWRNDELRYEQRQQLIQERRELHQKKQESRHDLGVKNGQPAGSGNKS